MDALLEGLVRQGPTVAVLVVVLWGFIRTPPWWVTGREYAALQADRDQYKTLALDLLHVAEKAVDGR